MLDQLTRIERRQKGFYETPEKTAAYMVEKLLPHFGAGARVLDPAAGCGVFVKELLKHLSHECIFAWDVDPETMPKLHALTPNAELRDALHQSSERFDAVICNPPYNSHECDYIRKNRSWLTREYGDVGLYNLYSLFTVSVVKRLREGGFACLILLDSFLTNTYHHRFRRFLLEHCKIHEIMLAPRRLFHAGNADVRTVIITLERCSDSKAREQNRMRLVDRVPDENAYSNPPKVEYLPQKRYMESDDFRFHIGVPAKIIDLVNNSQQRISDIVNGGAGISTGNDRHYLRRADEVSDDPDWVPFYKNSGENAYLAATDLRIHRDWRKGISSAPNYIARNREYYFQEGISCSSMGVRFSACYLPPGCLFGVNANLFLKKERPQEDLYYLLGFLNSTFVLYMLRAVLNRTNMVTPGYVKRLPFVEPDARGKEQVVTAVKQILAGLQTSPSFDYQPLAWEIDRIIFELYGICESDEAEIRDFCNHILERL